MILFHLKNSDRIKFICSTWIRCRAGTKEAVLAEYKKLLAQEMPERAIHTVLAKKNRQTASSRHLKNIFNSGELERNSVLASFATTATEGKIYQVEYFKLDAIISFGYRVNSIRGTRFRIWAIQPLREYFIKSFTLDDERHVVSKMPLNRRH